MWSGPPIVLTLLGWSQVLYVLEREVTFDYQPILKGDLVELRPLRPDDYGALYAIAANPLIWEQHPVKTRHEEEGFLEFFHESLDSGGALLALAAGERRVIGSSRFHGYDEERNEVEIGWTFLPDPIGAARTTGR